MTKQFNITYLKAVFSVEKTAFCYERGVGVFTETKERVAIKQVNQTDSITLYI